MIEYPPFHSENDRVFERKMDQDEVWVSIMLKRLILVRKGKVPEGGERGRMQEMDDEDRFVTV
jgi:hypothetical protein